MKIAISSQGPLPKDLFETRFGRAPFFVVHDSETGSFSSVNNHQNLNAVQGAGIQSAQNILNENVQVLITGHCGPKAWQVLSSADIKIYCTEASTVKDALDLFLENKLKALDKADVESHWL
jgi:predicted Fe-Mo cluster-binding NifX family protein